MKKKLFLGISVCMLALTMTACTTTKKTEEGAVSKSAAQENPQKVLDDSMAKATEVKSSKGAVQLTFSVDDGVDEMTGTASLTVSADQTLADNPLMNMVLTAAVDAGTNGAYTLKSSEFRVKDKKFYFNIGGLSIDSDDTEMAGMLSLVDSYFKKWYVIDPESPAVQGLMATAQSSLPLEADTETEMTAEQLQSLQDIVLKAKFVKDVTYSTEEKVDGVDCIKVSFSALDPDGIAALIQAISDEFAGTEGTDMTAADIQDIKDAVAMIDASGDFWIGKEDGILRKINLNIGVDEDGTTMNLGIVGTVTDINKAVVVEKPASAEDFMTVIEPFLQSMGTGEETIVPDLDTSYLTEDYGYSEEELQELMELYGQ